MVRAVSDSGYGSSPGNAMEMINWINKDSSAMGSMSLPVMRVTNGRKNSDHTAPDTFGFWCKKSAPAAGVQPRPTNRVPYNLEDAFTSALGAQKLRVNAEEVASHNATFAPSVYSQMLIGWGYLGYYPREGFRGHVYAVITGKGAPTAEEMAVLERYLGATAGLSI